MVVCGGFGLFLTSHTGGISGYPLLIGALICVAVGLLFYFVLGEKVDYLPKREGLILVGLSWVVFGVFGAIPYMVGDPSLPFADALFESVSGFSTTGSTVIEDLSVWPKDILLYRATTQWLGGLGILVLFMALLSSLGAGSKFLFKNESSFQLSEIAAVKIHDVALHLLYLYLVLTTICTLGLRCFGMDWFEAITHSFTTLSTAGFSIYNESIGYFKDWDTAWLIESWLILFMTLAALSFVFYLILWRRKFEKAWKLEEIWVYGRILLFGTLVLLVAEYPYMQDGNYLEWIRRTLFMVVSLSTTTGFGLISEREWPAFAYTVIVLLMIIGGCSGSTAGGVKVSRVIILWRITKQAMVKVFRPHQYMSLKINSKLVSADSQQMVVLFVALHFAILMLSTFLVSIFEYQNQIDFETSFGAVLTAISSVGPGLGAHGIWDNFASMHGVTKVFLSFIMILGRLEIFTLLALFTSTTWKRF